MQRCRVLQCADETRRRWVCQITHLTEGSNKAAACTRLYLAKLGELCGSKCQRAHQFSLPVLLEGKLIRGAGHAVGIHDLPKLQRLPLDPLSEGKGKYSSDASISQNQFRTTLTTTGFSALCSTNNDEIRPESGTVNRSKYGLTSLDWQNGREVYSYVSLRRTLTGQNQRSTFDYQKQAQS